MKDEPDDQIDPAVDLIRTKLSGLYSVEPNFEQEISEVAAVGAHSKHQQYMSRLMASGKSFADIQVAWHDYYQQLPDSEKHEVWEEFYANQSSSSKLGVKNEPSHKAEVIAEHTHIPATKPTKKRKIRAPESISEVKAKIKKTISADGKLEKKHHVKSLLFGLSLSGAFALIIVFALFNQIFMAPFITPSRSASASPLIVDTTGAVGPETKLIIPKLNLEAPIVLDLPDNKEETIQAGLEKGVTLYPSTGKPGELANPTIFGHSSNNLFNGGDYKFVFVRLNQLENGDTFFVNYSGKQYVYRVFDKKIVAPTQVEVLNERPKPAMITLITCDPPGTSTNRLVLHAEQISPDPGTNVATTTPTETTEPLVIPSDAESLIQRLFNLF